MKKAFPAILIRTLFIAIATFLSTPAAIAQAPVGNFDSGSSPTGGAAAVARFETECDRMSGMMMAAYRAASNSCRDIVSVAGEKLEEIGKDPEKRMQGNGIAAACAKGTITYLGMYGLLVVEAAGRCAGQVLPGGGIVGMVDSMLTDADSSVQQSGDAAKHWTHVAFIRCLMQLNGDSNSFHADFKKQLIESGSQPIVFVELQKMRRDIHDLLAKRYSAGVSAGIMKYGPTSVPEN